MLMHALAAAERGFAVCPAIVPEYMLLFAAAVGFKNAFTNAQRLHATTDARTIERWFDRFPKANIMIRTGRVSNVVVLDFDFHLGGRQAWGRLRHELPETLQVVTANGFHLYYRYPPRLVISTSFRQVEAGLDVLGEMGFVIVPPSRHPEGPRYRFEDPAVPIAELPEDFANRCAAVTPQPFWNPERWYYSETIRDYINLSYAHVVTVPNALRRYMQLRSRSPCP